MIKVKNSSAQLLKQISELKKQNQELKLYLNQIRIYKNYHEERLRSITGLFSLAYKTWKFYKKAINLFKYPERKKSENKMWEEIKSFHKERKPGSLDIFNFSALAYGYRHLRQQHLAEQLAKQGHRIFYIENDLLPIKKEAGFGSFNIKKHKDNIYLVTLSALRRIFIYYQKPNNQEISSILASLKNLKGKVGPTKSVAKIDYPFWGYLMDKLNMQIIYDCMDDYEGFEQTEPHILDIEKKLLKKSDLVLVCSNLLKAKLQKYLPQNTLLLKNAGDYEHFKKAADKVFKTPDELRKVKKPIIGYFGAIGEFINPSLLERIAKSFKDYSIVLIGELRNQEVINLSQKYKNIYTLGEKPYTSLPMFLQEFDVCIIPFIVNKSTRLIDPVKLYEYLSSGKPVVASDIKEIYEFSNVCYISKNNKNFVKNVAKALAEKDKTLALKRQKVAMSNTWEERGNILNFALEALVKHK